jgi:hypothetical protein
VGSVFAAPNTLAKNRGSFKGAIAISQRYLWCSEALVLSAQFPATTLIVAHNPKVGGSNPPAATTIFFPFSRFCEACNHPNCSSHP